MTRDDVIARARTGVPLGHSEFMVLVGLRKSAYFRRYQRHEFDALKLRPPLGKCLYSGTLVSRWLDTEPAPAPRFFGRKSSFGR
ncbi:MAG TPA: hypothetical protein VGG67_11870 [Steroidobacteraceae bacterium]|jgi:hypothetical protein